MPMLSPDYYWTLGLARYASDADVRKAYVFFCRTTLTLHTFTARHMLWLGVRIGRYTLPVFTAREHGCHFGK